MQSISVIIPCRDEADAFVKAAVEKIRRKFPRFKMDIMIIEGGSFMLKKRIAGTRYYNVKRKGLGRALKFGILRAKYEDVFFLPADMTYDLSFVRSALAEDADMVLGSKAVHGAVVKRPLKRKVASMLYHWKTKYIDRVHVRDITGVKLYKKSKIAPLLNACDSEGIKFEVQLQRQAERRNLKVKEIPVIVHDYRDKGILRWVD